MTTCPIYIQFPHITDKLDEMGIQYACFYEVAPDPTLQIARKGLEQLKAFQPDVIIALGGGSSMDAAKIMFIYCLDPVPRRLCFAACNRNLLSDQMIHQCG